MRLVRTGSWCRLVDIRDREAILKILDRHFAFKIEGAIFSSAYQSKGWDGRVHLIRRVRDGTLSLPAGIVPEALRRLDAAGYKVEIDDQRVNAAAIPRIAWRGPALRDYQIGAAQAAIAEGAGILKLPTRSGKTMLAAWIIREIGKRAIFVVTSDLLLRQATRVFSAVLGGASVTTIGDGSWDETGDVVVASIQTLQSRLQTPAFLRLSRSFGVAFYDEVHHIQGLGDAWRDTAIEIDAPVKFGLSATVGLSLTGENEEGSIWLRGICGPIIYEVGISDLIDRGFLVRPTIRFVRHGAPAMTDRRWSSLVLKRVLTECEPRNRRLADEAIQYARAGIGTLVDASRIPHIRILTDLISRGLPPGQVVALTGETPTKQRDRAIPAFQDGTVRVLVSTIMGEGVDVPEIVAVINSEGGRARTTTLQRLRNLTPAPGKTQAPVIEAADLHHPILREWTAERLKIYRQEPAFRCEIEPGAK